VENFEDNWNMLPENEPAIEVEIGEDSYEFRPENAELYTHVGRLAMYNCIFYQPDEDTAMYVFAEQEGFIELATLMANYGFPVFFNMREVEPYIKRAYENMLMRQVFEGIPDGMDEE
jgi:hypothetical protein